MILKTYSRIFTTELDATLQVLEPIVGHKAELRFPFLDMEVATLGDFCFLAGPAASMQPFLGAVGPILVDDLQAAQAQLERAGAQIVQPRTAVPTGWNLFTRDSQGVTIEWVQWTPEIWQQVREASQARLS